MLCSLALLPALARAATISVSYVPFMGELINPLIGNVAWANEDADHEQPFTLVYANLTWAELEPEEGRFDFASFEKKIALTGGVRRGSSSFFGSSWMCRPKTGTRIFRIG